MITAIFSIVFLVNDLVDWIIFPNWKWYLLVVLVIFFITIFFHILEKNMKIDDLENEQPNLLIKKIGVEPQTPTMVSSISDEQFNSLYHADEFSSYPSSDEPLRFQMSNDTKSIHTNQKEKKEETMAEDKYKSIRYRDSETGQFIPKKKAEQHPERTQREVNWIPKKKK